MTHITNHKRHHIFPKMLGILGVMASLLFLGIPQVHAQLSVSTTGSFLNNNGSGGVTFNLRNNNSFPIIITGIEGVTGTSGNVAVEFHTNPTPISSQPPAINTTNGWTQIASGTITGIGNTTTTATQTFFSGLSYVVPANTTIGMYVFADGQRYFTQAAGNYADSSNGVSILTGTGISWGGGTPPTIGTFTPRGWIGTIRFIPALACSGTPFAGMAASTTNYACSLQTFTLTLANDSIRQGLTYQWLSSTSGTNGTYSPILNDTTRNVTKSQTATTWYRCVVACGSNADTSAAVQVTTPTNPLSGTYTINPLQAISSTNYHSLSDMITEMNCVGITAPVTINIAPGITLNESIAFGNIQGLSATNTLTINGNGATVSSNASPIVSFSNSRFIIWNRLNVVGSTGFAGFGMHIGNTSNNITIKNSLIDVGINNTASTNAGIVVSGSQTTATTVGNNGRYITIDSNEVVGGYYSITLIGQSSYLNCFGNRITNNTVRDFYFYGIYLSNADSSWVENNDIKRDTRTTLSTFYGIYLATSRNIKIRNNKIHDAGIGTYTAYPIYVTTSVNTAGFETEFINNSIYNINTTGTIYGMYILGTRDRMNILHNTIVLSSSGTGARRGIWASTAPNNHLIKNNIISITGNNSGIKYCMYITTTSTSMVSNNNVLHMGATAGTNHIGYWTANRTSLSDWTTATTGRDSNSVNIDPLFLNEAIGNLTPLSVNVDNIGDPVGVTTDQKGVTRSILTPDAGAIEFSGVSGDVELMSAQLLYANGCNNLNDTLRIRIKNLIGNTIYFANDSLRINWSVTGPHNTSGILTLNTDSLMSGEERTITLSSAINRSTAGTYNALVYLGNNLKNQLGSNDTIRLTTYSSLSGTFTVGGTNPNFPTLQHAFDTLALKGVCGPVILNVAPGSAAHTNGLVINNIPGTNAVNQVRINGNGNTISNNVNPIVRLNGAKYVILDSLNIQGASGFVGFGVHISGASEFITIRKSVIDVGIANTSSLSAGIVISGAVNAATTAGNNANNVTIENNEIMGGYYGITLNGEASYLNNSGHIIRNNIIRDFYVYGVYSSNSDNLLFENNDLHRLNRTVITTFYGFYGTTTRNTKFHNNKIHDAGVGSYTAYPIWFATSANTLGQETEITNNLIYNINTTGTNYAMYFSTSTDGFRIYHNTVEVDGNGTGAKRAAFFAVAPNNTHFRNNILSVSDNGTGTGAKYCIYVSTTSTTFVSDRNVLHNGATGGTIANHIGYWTSNRTTLADWQAASFLDSNSVSNDPVFINPSVGNYTPLSINCDNIGTNVGVIADLNGVTRSVTTPDPGVFEFTGIAGDLALTNAELKRAGVCYGFNDTMKVTIQNTIGAGVNFSVNPLTIVYRVLGPVNTFDSLQIFTGTLPVGASQTFYVSTINMSIPGNYSLNAYIRPNAINNSQLNDTLNNASTVEVKRILSVSPKTTVVNSPTDTVVLTAQSPIFPSGGVKFTEICHWRLATGAAPAGGWPAYMLADDYVELTGIANSDIAGYIMEEWTGTTLQHTVTFPTGTVFSPNGTMILATGQLGSSVPSPSNFYYHTGNTVTHSSTGDNRGYLIKNSSGTIIDAVAFGTYSFPISSGVTSTDWTGNTSNVSSAGIRLTGPDLNNQNNWVVESTTGRQDPNILNSGVPMPMPGSMAGFNWSYLGSPIDTMPSIVVGPYNTPGTYYYIATYTNQCGTFTDTATIIASNSVPVQLVSLEADKIETDVLVKWTTASELNNNYFEVQRSIDGTNFETIGKVEGNGTTVLTQQYQYIDKNVVSVFVKNKFLFYRLKQVDLDGTSELSKTISVDLDPATIKNFEVFPNPNQGRFTISIESQETTTSTIKIYNTIGLEVFSTEAKLNTGQNIIGIESALPQGVYMMIVTDRGIDSVKKFVISK